MLNPSDENIKYNLALTRTFVVDKIETVDTFFLKKWWQSIINDKSVTSWLYLSIVLFLVAVLLMMLYSFSGKLGLKRASFFGAIPLILFSVLFFIIASQRNKVLESHSEAIVLSETVTVKSAPDNSGTDLFVIHEGTKVKVRDSVSGWNEIILSNGSVGWLRSADIEQI